MLTLILAEYTSGEIHCSVKIGGQTLIRERAVDWNQALKWAQAVVSDPPEKPPTPRTRYPPAAPGTS